MHSINKHHHHCNGSSITNNNNLRNARSSSALLQMKMTNRIIMNSERVNADWVQEGIQGSSSSSIPASLSSTSPIANSKTLFFTGVGNVRVKSFRLSIHETPDSKQQERKRLTSSSPTKNNVFDNDEETDEQDNSCHRACLRGVNRARRDSSEIDISFMKETSKDFDTLCENVVGDDDDDDYNDVENIKKSRPKLNRWDSMPAKKVDREQYYPRRSSTGYHRDYINVPRRGSL